MLRYKLAKEIEAWMVASRSVRIAHNLLSQTPEDTVLIAKLQTAKSQRKEATDMLRAALRATGSTPADLQAELSESCWQRTAPGRGIL